MTPQEYRCRYSSQLVAHASRKTNQRTRVGRGAGDGGGPVMELYAVSRVVGANLSKAYELRRSRAEKTRQGRMPGVELRNYTDRHVWVKGTGRARSALLRRPTTLLILFVLVRLIRVPQLCWRRGRHSADDFPGSAQYLLCRQYPKLPTLPVFYLGDVIFLLGCKEWPCNTERCSCRGSACP